MFQMFILVLQMQTFVASDGDLDASDANFHAVNADCNVSNVDLML